MERGYAGFTTRLVAEAAGISPGNLSYHLPNKSELLSSVRRLSALANCRNRLRS